MVHQATSKGRRFLNKMAENKSGSILCVLLLILSPLAACERKDGGSPRGGDKLTRNLTVNATVIDERDGQPVPDAKLYFYDLSQEAYKTIREDDWVAVTDEEGMASWEYQYVCRFPEELEGLDEEILRFAWYTIFLTEVQAEGYGRFVGMRGYSFFHEPKNRIDLQIELSREERKPNRGSSSSE